MNPASCYCTAWSMIHNCELSWYIWFYCIFHKVFTSNVYKYHAKGYTGHKILYQKYMDLCCTTCAIFLLMWLMLFFTVIGKTKIDTHITCFCLQKCKMPSIKEHPMQIIKNVCSITNYNNMPALVHLILWPLGCVGNFTIAFFKLISWIDFLVSSYCLLMWSPETYRSNLKCALLQHAFMIDILCIYIAVPSYEYHRTLLMIGQQWFR